MKDLVVFLDGAESAHRLRFAIGLAVRFGLHMAGACVVNWPAVPELLRSGVLDRLRRLYLAERGPDFDEMRQNFVDAVRREKPDAPPDWRLLDGGPEAAVAYGRLFDLVIVGADGADRHAEPIPALLPEQMALGSGRPVLVMPRRDVPETAGRHVAIAWNGSREAARAVHDAMPFLATAEQVTVLSVGEGEGTNGGDPLLAAHLARHDIAAAFRWVPCRAHGEVDALLLDIDRDGVDLLVMGCYGRARGVELVLGGMSRDLPQRSPVPLLMSH